MNELTLQLRDFCVTFNSVPDAAVLPQLLVQVSTAESLLTATGDGVYDTQPVHAACRGVLEKLEWLPPTQLGEDQDSLHQAGG